MEKMPFVCRVRRLRHRERKNVCFCVLRCFLKFVEAQPKYCPTAALDVDVFVQKTKFPAPWTRFHEDRGHRKYFTESHYGSRRPARTASPGMVYITKFFFYEKSAGASSSRCRISLFGGPEDMRRCKWCLFQLELQGPCFVSAG